MAQPSVQIANSRSDLVEYLRLCISNVFSSSADNIIIALSGFVGGSIISLLVDVFATFAAIPKNVHFVFADERKVPVGDPESTYGSYLRKCLDLPVLKDTKWITIDANLSLTECAQDYERKLRHLCGNQHSWPHLDLVLLGMGPDGHTASLFPGHRLMTEAKNSQDWVLSLSDSPKPPPERITLSLPTINAAKRIVFVCTGKEKANVVKQILAGNGKTFPAANVKAQNGEVVWLLDQDASSLLENSLST